MVKRRYDGEERKKYTRKRTERQMRKEEVRERTQKERREREKQWRRATWKEKGTKKREERKRNNKDHFHLLDMPCRTTVCVEVNRSSSCSLVRSHSQKTHNTMTNHMNTQTHTHTHTHTHTRRHIQTNTHPTTHFRSISRLKPPCPSVWTRNSELLHPSGARRGHLPLQHPSFRKATWPSCATAARCSVLLGGGGGMCWARRLLLLIMMSAPARPLPLSDVWLRLWRGAGAFDCRPTPCKIPRLFSLNELIPARH